MATKKQKHVIVTDSHRGVVYGKLVELNRDAKHAVLADARHVYSWARNEKAQGLFGLAVAGPAEGSRIGPPVTSLEVFDVSKVLDVSDEAVKVFAERGWES